MITLRAATTGDLDEILPRTRALQDHEGIVIATPQLRAALEKLLGDAGLGGVWVIEDEQKTIGYTIVTYGFDLEFGGRDAWLTELWVDEAARGRGAGTAALALLEPELRARDVKAYHLQVREENPALRLYERNGFVRVPRLLLTRRLS